MSTSEKTKVAIIGSGNIGTDLMIKVHAARPSTSRWARWSASTPTPTASPAPRGSASPTTARGRRRADRACRTSTRSRSSSTPPRPRRTQANAAVLRSRTASGSIDLTPGGDRPVRRPGGQPRRAPRRAATSTWSPAAARPRSRSSPRSRRVAPVPYAEIVASIASQVGRARARAPTSTSSPRPPRAAIEAVGGAARGKAIIVLNPAEPPLIMRDTVLLPDRRPPTTTRSAPRSRRWSPTSRRTCRLPPQAGGAVRRRSPTDEPVHTLLPDGAGPVTTKVSVFLEVEGAAHYLPAYAGNLDIMTSAALRIAERMVAARSADGDGSPMTDRRSTSRTSPCATACTPSATGITPDRRRRDRRRARRRRRRRDRGRARRRPRRRQRSTTAPARTPTGSGSRPPPTVHQNAPAHHAAAARHRHDRRPRSAPTTSASARCASPPTAPRPTSPRSTSRPRASSAWTSPAS